MERDESIDNNRLITISKLHFAAVLFFCIGLFVLITGLLRIYAMKHPVILGDLSLYDLRAGTYVKDEVDHLAVSWYSPPSGGIHYNGCYLESLNGIFWSNVTDYYVAPIGDGSAYVSLLVPKEKSEPFSKLTDEPGGESVAFTARIVRLRQGYETNYPFMENALGASPEELESCFSLNYGIQLVEEEKEKLLWIKGFGLMAVGLFLWLAGSFSKGSFTLQIRKRENGK